MPETTVTYSKDEGRFSRNVAPLRTVSQESSFWSKLLAEVSPYHGQVMVEDVVSLAAKGAA